MTIEPLHVGLNAHLLSGVSSYRSAGVHQYVYHLLRFLPQAGCRLTALLGPRSLEPEGDYAIRRSRWPSERPPVRVLWEQIVQPSVVRREGIDLIHGPAFVVPLLTPCPSVVTIHDLSFIRFPNLFRPANRLYLTLLTRASVRRAGRVIAVSAHAAEETVRLLGIDRDKITVVYHGVDPDFHPRSEKAVGEFRARKQLPARFILFLGTLEPRKNLIRLVEAFGRLRERGLKLVLAGGRGWYYEEIFDRVEQLGLRDDVIFPGYVPAEELPIWYNAADLFAYPSLYEGFGMPVTEAQASGTPVLTSNVSSLPEAAGEGALLVDPHDVAAIAEGLNRLLTDSALRDALRERAMAHVRALTWQKTADDTLAVYRQVLDEEPRIEGHE